jgi:pyrimidine-nucleoside phosphorylase
MMVKIGNGAGRKTCAVISQMNEPLGRAVGNGIEVIEAVKTLKGEGEDDLLELCLELGSLMVSGADSSISGAEARNLLMETVSSGRAYAKFREFVAAQGGNLDYIDNCNKLVNVKEILEIKSDKAGYVKSINTYDVGRAVMLLGGGREKKGDDIDHNVGVLINKKVGDYVEEGESIATMYVNDGTNKAQAAEMLKNAYEYSSEAVEKLKLVQRVVE